MKVVFNTWSGAFFHPGGGEVQLLQTKLALEKSGTAVDFYDQWSPQTAIDVFHQFSIQPGGEHPMRAYKALGKKIALSTILWGRVARETEFWRDVREKFLLADALLTNSDAESKQLSDVYEVDLAKFHKTRNAVSSDFMDKATTQDFRKTYGLENNFILSVANIDRRKNTRALCEAVQRLGKKLVLVGHVRDREFFDECQRTFPETMLYVGPIANAELLKSAYQQCDVYALPSLCETPGIAALEAASQGAKIVITHEGSTQEYFGEFATYVDPLSVTSICEGLSTELEISRDPLRSSAHILNNFTWAKTAHDVLAAYDSMF